MMNANDIKVKV